MILYFIIEDLKILFTEKLSQTLIDFSEISLTQVISKAVNDAELLMQQGKYDSAFDRVHTAFHGYLRKILNNRNVQYEESDTLN